MPEIIELPILHFNDVYRVNQRYVPEDGVENREGGPRYISAAQFARQLDDVRDGWADSPIGQNEKEGLVLFSGDVFSPSVESTITRGSHMVPLLNRFHLAASCLGNHDVDYGWPHLSKLVADLNFPWLLSNVIDTNTGKTPEPMHEYLIVEKCGVKIGLVGLVEGDWIATIPSFPENFKHQPMAERARDLSAKLRDELGCDIVIALTHSRVGNDIKLANDTGAIKWAEGNTDRPHGLDILLGGHDHQLYIGRGADKWDNWNQPEDLPGTEDDKDCLIVKSLTDFRVLGSFTLGLELNPSYPASSPRKYLVRSLVGKKLDITPDSPTNPEIQELIDGLLKDIGKTLDKPACFTVSEWDCRSEIVRTRESAIGNWMADVMLHSYSDALEAKGVSTDIVMICGGAIRGDSRYGPGVVTLGDILEILPFTDAIVVIQLDGEAIWDALEGALGKYPAQEGRFPIFAGMEVVADTRQPPGQRVKSVHLVSHHHRRQKKPVNSRKSAPPTLDGSDSDEGDAPGDESTVQFYPHPQKDGVEVEVRLGDRGQREELKREKGGRLYTVVTREYMALGYDGYEAMKNGKMLIDDESGLIMSTIIRQFLLGATFIMRKRRLMERRHQLEEQEKQNKQEKAPSDFLSPKTEHALSWQERGSKEQPQDGGQVVNQGWRSVRNAIRIARREHMSEVDECSGESFRKYQSPAQPTSNGPMSPPKSPTSPTKDNDVDAASSSRPEDCTINFFVQARTRDVFRALEDDVAVVAPFVDGRLKDLGRS